jgi:16S rRNA (guanine966-N2)-methyltransferase
MRIITGEYKSRVLEGVNGEEVRPATGRVRGAIFNMLQNRLGLENAHVLDLYAGSGGLAFEALSRGAAKAVFVELNPAAVDVINSNAEALGCIDRCDIVHGDAVDYINHTRESFDLIFADPPYKNEETVELPSLIMGNNLLSPEGFLIIEHPQRLNFASSELYQIASQKKFGNTVVTFFTTK